MWNSAKAILAFFAIAITQFPTQAALRFARRSQSTSFRNRLTISPLIAAPGTFELDVVSGFTASGSYWMPTTLRFTPDVENSVLKHIEWGISGDLFDSFVTNGERVTQFPSQLTFASTAAVKLDGINFGLAPAVTRLTRGDGGWRGGGSALVRVDPGLNSFGATLSWTGATRPSDSNPTGVWDLTLAAGHKLGHSHLLNQLTAHASVTGEKQTGASRFYTLLAGMEYQMRDHFSIDLSTQHVGISTGVVDHQILLGVNWTIRGPR